MLRACPNVTSKSAEMVTVTMKPISNEPRPFACQGVGPSSSRSRRIEKSVDPPERTATWPAIVGDELEWVELDERVETDEAVDVEDLDAVVELDLGAELHGVRRDREIGLRRQARIACPHRNGQPVERRKIERRRPVVGVEAADGQQEIGVVAPVDAHRHVAGEREGEQP